ncbi:MAG: hypothetical protein AB1736_10105 [Chloroflexota bacterium]
MIEYGGGIEHGPAGQVGGNPPVGGGSVDLGASAGDFVDRAVQTVSTMEPTVLLLWIVGILFGLAMLRRAL